MANTSKLIRLDVFVVFVQKETKITTQIQWVLHGNVSRTANKTDYDEAPLVGLLPNLFSFCPR